MSSPLPSADADHPHSRLSRLLDGDLESSSAEDACIRWHDDAKLRDTWHRYHLIGDVMRSQELASSPDRDARFLIRLRERLASEPPLLAPAPVAVMAARAAFNVRQRWWAPAAVAAGFVAVAGVLVVSRMSQPGAQPAATLAAGAPEGDALRRASTAGAAAGSRAMELEAAMVRDAEIDRYFRAHREMRVSPAAALPGGAPRNIEAIVMQR